MNFNDLQEALRTNGNFSLEEVLYAVMQTNGTLSVLPRGQYCPLNASLLQINVNESELPIIIVAEGKTLKENINLAKIDENFILKNISSLGFKSIDEILILTLSNSGTIYVQGKSGSCKSKKISYSGDW